MAAPLQPRPREEISSSEKQQLKDEIQAFGRNLRDELEVCEWENKRHGTEKPVCDATGRNITTATKSSPHSLTGVFTRLWQRGSVGPMMKRFPCEAERLMKRWATGKLTAHSLVALLTSRQFASAEAKDAYYTLRSRTLLSFVAIKLFAVVSSSYFAAGPAVLGSSDDVVKRLKRCLSGKTQDGCSNSASDNSEGGECRARHTRTELNVLNEDHNLFNADDEEVRVPLTACPSQCFSQDSLSPCSPVTPAAFRTRKYDIASHNAVESQDGFSLSRFDSAFSASSTTIKNLCWPVANLNNSDPQPDVVEEVVKWLRLCMLSIDFDPASSLTDTEAEMDKTGTGLPNVYPFEQTLNDSIIPTFVLTIPLTLKKVYKELEVSPATSEVLSTALKLRQALGSEEKTWPAVSDVRPAKTPADASSETPKKKRKAAQPLPAALAAPTLPPAKKQCLLQLELQTVKNTQNARSKFSSPHFSSRLSFAAR